MCSSQASHPLHQLRAIPRSFSVKVGIKHARHFASGKHHPPTALMGCLTRSAPARPCPWLYACAYVTDVAGFASKRRRLCPRGVTDADPASADRGCVFDGSAPFSGTTLRLCTPGCRAAGNATAPTCGNATGTQGAAGAVCKAEGNATGDAAKRADRS